MAQTDKTTTQMTAAEYDREMRLTQFMMELITLAERTTGRTDLTYGDAWDTVPPAARARVAARFGFTSESDLRPN